MKRFNRILPHLTIILAGMFIVFWILDILNPTMNFINRKVSNKLLLLFCILAIATAIMNVYYERKYDILKNNSEDSSDNDAEELKAIMETFAASGWDLISVPAQKWLDGKGDKDSLIYAIKQADRVCGDSGCDMDSIYKRALKLL